MTAPAAPPPVDLQAALDALLAQVELRIAREDAEAARQSTAPQPGRSA